MQLLDNQREKFKVAFFAPYVPPANRRGFWRGKKKARICLIWHIRARDNMDIWKCLFWAVSPVF